VGEVVNGGYSRGATSPCWSTPCLGYPICLYMKDEFPVGKSPSAETVEQKERGKKRLHQGGQSMSCSNGKKSIARGRRWSVPRCALRSKRRREGVVGGLIETGRSHEFRVQLRLTLAVTRNFLRGGEKEWGAFSPLRVDKRKKKLTRVELQRNHRPGECSDHVHFYIN